MLCFHDNTSDAACSLLCFQDRVSELPPGPSPPFFKKLFSLLSKASVDRKPDNSSFGDVLQQVYPVYRQVI